MPRPLPDVKRQAIIADIEAGQKSRNQIARDHDVSVGTVTNLAPAGAFDRSKTVHATRAKQMDSKARRAELAALLLDDAFRIRERVWERSKQVTNSGAIVTLNLPPARDTKDFIAAVSGAVRSHAELEKLDSDTGTDAARSMLGALGEALQVAAGQITGTTSEEPPESG